MTRPDGKHTHTTLSSEKEVVKDWSDEPIPIGPIWRTQYCASTYRHWTVGHNTIGEAIEEVLRKSKPAFKIVSVGKYETRSTSRVSGVRFVQYVPVLDEEDMDITRNLERIF